MDVGDYDTNTLLITNISSIAFRIYEPVAAPSSAYTFAASDVEEALRNDGHLVYMDAVRRSIWCFYVTGKDASSSSQPEQHGLGATMEVCGYLLRLVEEGCFEPVSLLKNRQPGANPTTTPTSSSSSGSALDLPAKSAHALSASSANTPGAGPMDLDTKVPPSTIPDAKGYGTVPVREIHEFFIAAALSSLSAAFCHQTGAIPLNHRTVLLTPRVFYPDYASLDPNSPLSALATFRVYLTTTGSLIIALCVSFVKGLVASAEYTRLWPLASGTSVLTAPMGAFASFSSVMLDGDNNGLGQSPDTQISRFRPEPPEKLAQWKSTCSRLLQMRGMSPSLLEGCSWFNIHFAPKRSYEQRADGKKVSLIHSGPMAPWPSALCFCRAKGPVGHLQAATVTRDKNFDHLGFALDWLAEAPKREELLARRKKEREAAIAAETAEADGTTQPPGGYSPLQLRAPSNIATNAAAGAIYPTPPDAVQPPGVTPSFDGTVSSPGNPPAAATMVDIDAQLETIPAPDGFDDPWDGSDPKREQQNVPFLEGDNLFGDLGDDVFDNNELTDADFNFFDEEPEAVDLDMDALPDIPDMDVSAEMIPAAPEATEQADVAEEEPKGNVHQASPDFSKPESKRTRGSLAEESRQQANMQSFEHNASIGIKRQPSPFNADTVYKRIRASLHGLPATAPGPEDSNSVPRRGSVFEKVDFGPALSLANKKYEEQGQFNPSVSLKKNEASVAFNSANPLTTRLRKSAKDLPSGLGSLIAKITGGLENSSLHNNLARREDPPSDADDVSLVSDQDDSSESSDEPMSPAISSVVKRRPDDDVASMAASFKDLESTAADSPTYGSIDLSRLSNAEMPELSLAKYFTDPEPVSTQLFRSDQDWITVAQIVTEQAASGDLKLTAQNMWTEPQETRRGLMGAIRRSMRGLRSSLPRSLGDATECQLRPFMEAQDVPLLGQPSRVATRPMGQEIVRPTLFQIPAPHVELRRNESKISMLPSAVAFWDSIGLGPVQGSKDVVSVCVFPSWEGMRQGAGDFLEGIRGAYESLKLGTLERLPAVNGIEDGLLAVDPGPDASSSTPRMGSSMADYMSRLSMALAASTQTERNFVIFFIYDPGNPGSIVDACSAFQELFERYKKVMADRKKPIVNDLVMQLISLELVASATTMVALAPQDYFKLCIETYDRCTSFEGPMPAPAIVLEQPLPRGIDFKLMVTPSANLMREKSCIHVAYAQSVDDRWITAAWTDNQGSKQMTASYCLGRRGKPLSMPFGDVAQEIWESTQDLISECKVHWRVIVTKCGPMDQAEADCWIGFAQAESRNTVTLTLMTVDTNPSLQLIPPVARIPLNMSSMFYSTPVSTPQPSSIVSPDQSANNPSTPIGATPGGPGNATTPGGSGGDTGNAAVAPAAEAEGDTTMVDVTDTTWGVVLSHRLNNSTSLTELNPALASGYLVKRGGTSRDDPPVVLEVNVVHSEGNPRLYEGLLREMMAYFRGLATLARAKGVVDQVTDVRPWHVAAAEKGVRILCQLM